MPLTTNGDLAAPIWPGESAMVRWYGDLTGWPQ